MKGPFATAICLAFLAASSAAPAQMSRVQGRADERSDDDTNSDFDGQSNQHANADA